MSTAQPELKPNRRGVWLAVAVVVALLALTTWDILRNSDRSSPAALRRAAFDGDEATVRRLLAAHPEWLNQPGFHQAASFSFLLDNGRVLLGPKGPVYYPPGSGQLFRLLEAYGAAALHHALANSQSRVAMVLIQAGANVHATLTNGYPAIAGAVSSCDTNVVAAMLQRGVRLDAVDTLTKLPVLHFAVQIHRTEMVAYLLKHGAPINATNQFGGTALHLAADSSELPLVGLLATNGADLLLTNRAGKTALDLALMNASSNRASRDLANWLSAYAATNPPPAKPAP
jgi:ankyrin repeat protein